jgi:hypothetical protein
MRRPDPDPPCLLCGEEEYTHRNANSTRVRVPRRHESKKIAHIYTKAMSIRRRRRFQEKSQSIMRPRPPSSLRPREQIPARAVVGHSLFLLADFL